MLFNTFQFVLFFAALLFVYWSAPARWRNGILFGASLLFYVLWIPVYLLLFLAEIVVNYALMRAMLRSSRPKIYVGCAIAFTLGLLAYFKYAAFLSESLAPMTEGLFGWTPPAAEVLLPLAISFYSFQILALTIDVYRGQIEPPKSFAR